MWYWLSELSYSQRVLILESKSHASLLVKMHSKRFRSRFWCKLLHFRFPQAGKNQLLSAFTVESTLVGSKILKKGKCICKTIEMCFKGLISVPIYVRSIEKHARHLVWTFFWKRSIFEKKSVDPPFFLMFSLYMLYKQILTKIGSWGWSKLFSKNFLKFDF